MFTFAKPKLFGVKGAWTDPLDPPEQFENNTSCFIIIFFLWVVIRGKDMILQVADLFLVNCYDPDDFRKLFRKSLSLCCVFNPLKNVK